MSSATSPPKPPPCKETICSTKKDAFKSMLAAQGSKPGPSAPAAPCPPDREELGRHTWTLMHTMAAYFPEKPTAAEGEAAASFLHVLGGLYPCGHCAEDFRTSLEESPPRTGSRGELCVWMCEAHNRVNRLLGKAEFSCELSQLDTRWRDGGERCGGEAIERDVSDTRE